MFCSLFSGLLIAASMVSGTITLSVVGTPTVHASVSVNWARDHGDPEKFSIKEFVDAQLQTPGSIFPNVISGGATTGEAHGIFQVPGPHHLRAIIDPQNPGQALADIPLNVASYTGQSPSPASFSPDGSNPVPVSTDVTGPTTAPPEEPTPQASFAASTSSSDLDPPLSTSSTLITDSSSSSISSPSQVGISESSSVSPPPSSSSNSTSLGASHQSNSHKSRTPIIVGAVIGGTVGLCVLGVVILKLLLRRHAHHQRPRSFDGDMMVRSSRNTSTSLPPYVHSATNSTAPLNNHAVMAEVPSSSSTARIAAMNQAPSRSDSPAVLGYDSDMEKSYHFPSISEPPQSFPLTDRQMQLHERIQELHGKIINLKSENEEWRQIEEKIATLKALQTGEWAREVSDVMPHGLA